MPVKLLNNYCTFKSVASPSRTNGCEGSIVYGLIILYSDEIVYQMPDISPNEMDVLRLIVMIKDQDVSTQQLPDIIEDFVQQISM